MNCLLWHDGLSFGCVDIEDVIGRSLFPQGKYMFMPRRLLYITTGGKHFWIVSRATEHDTISIEIYEPPNWQVLEQAPKAIDDNTMIRVIFHGKFTFRFIFLGGLSCQEASILEDVWSSPIWEKKLGTTEPPPIAAPPPAAVEVRAMRVMDWWARYLKENSWAAMLAILLLGVAYYLWSLR